MWGERQAVLFDLNAHRFYIFGLVLFPQDLIYLAAILMISALSLFLFTAVAGRLWCGFSCPQSVYTEMFMWIERKVEGDRSARIRLDNAPWTADKFYKKSLKHGLWLALAIWTGFTFIGYFAPIRGLLADLMSWSLGPWQIFWFTFYSFATYGNAGFMREQVCKYMCPYARFQSAMFDKDTLIVAYDSLRGEPRGGRSRKVDPKTKGLGDCIDCTLCVQVCPTGIDIRKGLQYECISCGACADVCDSMMKDMGYATGLVKFTTENGMQNRWTKQQMVSHIFRPRVLIYTAILATFVIGLGASVALKSSFKVDVIRDRGVMARINAKGLLENVYRLQIMNASEQAQQYSIAVNGLQGLEVSSDSKVEVSAASEKFVPVRLQLSDSNVDIESGSHTIHFEVKSASGELIREESKFLVPRE